MSKWVGLCWVGLMVSGAGAQQGQTGLQAREGPAPKSNGPAALVAPARRDPARPANADPNYREMRDVLPNGPGIAVDKLVLVREAGTITLLYGAVYPYGDGSGRCTGALFLGEGSFHVAPADAAEQRQMKLVMKTEVLDQRFTSAVLRFTDGTWAELKRGGGEAVAPSAAAVTRATDAQTLFRKEMRYDIEARLLEDGAGAGGFFAAEMKGPLFAKTLVYFVDPQGAAGVAPEEVELLTSGNGSFDVAMAARSAKAREGAQSAALGIGQQTIDVSIERDGRLTATALSVVTAKKGGLRALPLLLFPTLRVSGVWGPSGEALDFVQEDKERDADFTVVLKKPLAAGESIQLMTTYAGKDAVVDEGNGNYNPVARESWYPNVRGGEFGNYAYYEMTFRTPKTVEVVATGDRVAQGEVDGKRTSRWETLAPVPVAGFSLGDFKSDTSEQNKDVQVISYANVQLADRYSGMAGGTMGTLSTTGMLKRATSEADAAVKIYTAYFGPLPYDHVSVTEQTACTYGQSWPMLVYLPVCYFWDNTVLHQMGVLDSDPSYWKVVTAHEVAHQWWGSTVGFASYRDQWMSEGFADFSASLFLLETRKDMKEYRDFWALLRRRLLEKNAMGVRPVDVGPVVMGGRVDTSRSGSDVYQTLVYPKGAYILHMLEMMFWTPQYGEKPFQAAMKDFVKQYRNHPATTEDFKAAMERDMPPWMDLDRNHRLDWFFQAYVYGTEIPRYAVTSEFVQKGDDVSVHIKQTQSGVSSGFKMMVPLYVEYADKEVKLLGQATIQGSMTLDQTLDLGKLPKQPKRILANYNYDVLSD